MKLRGRELYIIVGVVAVVIGVLWYFFLFSPEQKKIADLEHPVRGPAARAAPDQHADRSARAAQEDRTAGRSRPHQAAPGHADRRGHPVVHRRADQDGPKLGARHASSVTPGATAPGVPFSLQSIQLEFDGAYFDVEDFLYRLENYVDYRNGQFLVTGRMFSVVSLTLAKSTSKDFPDLDAHCDDQRIPMDSHWGLHNGGRCAMMTINKSNAVLVIVVVAAIAMASVVAVHGHGAGTTALGAYGADNPAVAGLADTSTVASSTGSGASAVDPAKQDPTLDQFHSRNPFIQATAAPVTSGGTSPDGRAVVGARAGFGRHQLEGGQCRGDLQRPEGRRQAAARRRGVPDHVDRLRWCELRAAQRLYAGRLDRQDLRPRRPVQRADRGQARERQQDGRLLHHRPEAQLQRFRQRLRQRLG